MEGFRKRQLLPLMTRIRPGIRGYGEAESPSSMPECSYHEVSYELLQAILAAVKAAPLYTGLRRVRKITCFEKINREKTTCRQRMFFFKHALADLQNSELEKCTILLTKLCEKWRCTHFSIVHFLSQRLQPLWGK